MNLYVDFPHLYSDLGEIRYTISVGFLRVS
jgi:hypothetical protein